MTLTSSRMNPELADTPCSVAECLEPACHMARAVVKIDPTTCAPPDFEVITFGLPLCVNHAHLLRRGCSLTHFDSGV
jgi:hypothetical protein